MKYKNYYIRSFINAPFQMACSSPNAASNRWSCSNILYTIKFIYYYKF